MSRLPHRRNLLAMVTFACLCTQTGCAGLGLGAPRPVTWFTLNDLREDTALLANQAAVPAVASAMAGRQNTAVNQNQAVPTQARAAITNKALIIDTVNANPFYDSTQLAYSRSDIARAYYQFAAWTERPGKRLADLVEKRIAARGSFPIVAASTAGLSGDLVLALHLDELFHDAASRPAVARVAVRARLIDQRHRTLIAQRAFDSGVPVEKADAASAVRALSLATTKMLDELATWVEDEAR